MLLFRKKTATQFSFLLFLLFFLKKSKKRRTKITPKLFTLFSLNLSQIKVTKATKLFTNSRQERKKGKKDQSHHKLTNIRGMGPQYTFDCYNIDVLKLKKFCKKAKKTFCDNNQFLLKQIFYFFTEFF